MIEIILNIYSKYHADVDSRIGTGEWDRPGVCVREKERREWRARVKSFLWVLCCVVWVEHNQRKTVLQRCYPYKMDSYAFVHLSVYSLAHQTTACPLCPAAPFRSLLCFTPSALPLNEMSVQLNILSLWRSGVLCRSLLSKREWNSRSIFRVFVSNFSMLFHPISRYFIHFFSRLQFYFDALCSYQKQLPNNLWTMPFGSFTNSYSFLSPSLSRLPYNICTQVKRSKPKRNNGKSLQKTQKSTRKRKWTRR